MAFFDNVERELDKVEFFRPVEKHETMLCSEGEFRIDFVDPNGDIVPRVLRQGESMTRAQRR